MLGARGIRPKKRFGQHFLMDGKTSARIARLAVDAPGDRVLEIGAGTGALTAALVALGADVTAFDVDPDMVGVLQARADLQGIDVRQADALTFDYTAWAGDRPWRAAGNLPYNVGTPTLVLLAGLPHPPERIVAMLQKDVADRLLAKPGTAQYGSLTIAVGLTMEVQRALTVPPSAFYPQPGVVSSVVVLRRRERLAADVRDRKHFEQVVRAAFAYRRKTLANSLSLALGIPRERIAKA
ncbi:MAG TPA: 16S rRNA (adenine(1518)-N(6)/adenine(1519)-N(6))-dimethyltransferase RsmA, partial [Candidatus Acidoferrum sp.]|nr:16S rRNA (adenine(1518)-N(6)/adenine(1519)-N(6))-dimethyltransferase RsmA [Candidatus Acidoferrum sp.]